MQPIVCGRCRTFLKYKFKHTQRGGNHYKKSFLGTTFLALLAAASLAGCSSSSNETTAETAAETSEESTAEAKEADGDLEKLVVGASPAPHAEILEAARDLLADKGYDLEIVEYTDYVQPNNALESGDLDANYFQHKTISRYL